jgi:HEAT repeat protein
VAGLEKVPKLIAELDSNDFSTRQQATRQLESLGEVAKPALEKALDDNPSAEMRRRIEAVLEKLKGPIPAELMRAFRAIDVLEHIGSRQAQQVLETLAQGAPASFVSQAAKASLERSHRKAGK